MAELTKRQQQILNFIQSAQQSGHTVPTLREIAAHFGFASTRAAADHLAALKRKGVLTSSPGQARSLRVISPLQALRRLVVDIPLLGSIPAGFADDRKQEAKGCVSIDIETLGLKPTPRTFALEVRGDSMIGKGILDGDLVVLEHGMTPRHGDVVAALIDNESTLKTFQLNRGKPFLRAENPKFPDLIPAQELVIQGVLKLVIRRAR